jgi:hypothetical protein
MQLLQRIKCRAKKPRAEVKAFVRPKFKDLSNFQRWLSTDLVAQIASFLGIPYRCRFSEWCTLTRDACKSEKSFCDRLQFTQTHLAGFHYEMKWTAPDWQDYGSSRVITDHEVLYGADTKEAAWGKPAINNPPLTWLSSKIKYLHQRKVQLKALDITVPCKSEMKMLNLYEPLISSERFYQLRLSLPNFNFPEQAVLHKEIASWIGLRQRLQDLTMTMWGADNDARLVEMCETLCQLPELRTLDIRCAQNVEFYAVRPNLAEGGFIWKTNLTCLKISGLDLANNAMRLFEQAPGLTALSLYGCKLENHRDITRFSGLTRLALKKVHPLTRPLPWVAHDMIHAILERVGRKLESLKLSEFAYIQFNALQFLEHCPNLRNLCLHWMDLRRMNLYFLFALPQLRHLCTSSSDIDVYTWMQPIDPKHPYRVCLPRLTHLNVQPHDDNKICTLEVTADWASAQHTGLRAAFKGVPLKFLYGLHSVSEQIFEVSDEPCGIQQTFQRDFPDVQVIRVKNEALACPCYEE